VLLVTHDEDLVDEVATRLWHFEKGKVEDFLGTYEEYSTVAAVK
jgi:ATPase subunit of ABC transporter with duplicated ATPase domains